MDRAIIISNGRCGSTLLSDLIVDEPETCSAQEFFMAMAPWSRSTEVISGPDYWAVLAGPKAELSILVELGIPPKEMRYPSTGRFAGDMVNLPRILAITLAKLTDDPDTLYDKLEPGVKAFPTQSIADHHRSFLDLLAATTGKKRWVERSGGSSQVALSLLKSYPDAKIVYLTRDWGLTAKSMSKHSSFQLVQLRIECLGRFGLDPMHLSEGAEIPEEMKDFLPENLTADVLRERGTNLKKFMALCAFMSSQAEQAIADHPPAQYYQIAYEDLLVDPEAELTRLGEFLGFTDAAGWAATVAGKVRKPEPVAVAA